LIYDVGLSIFLQNIVRSSKYPIHTHLIATLLSQVQLERDGETITRSTVRECVDILLRLTVPEREGGKNVYLTDFEPEFLKRSAEFYRLEAVEFLETGDAPQYLRNVGRAVTCNADGQVEKRLAEESDRTAHYLSTLTHIQLQELLVAELLTPHLDAILHMAGSGLVTMVDHDRTSDLSRMYKLFLLVPLDLGKDALRFALRVDVEERGKAINDSANEPEPGPSTAAGDGNQDMEGGVKGKGKVKPVTSTSAALTSALRWVQDVLDLKDKFDKILDQAFGGDKAVQTSINLVSPISLLVVAHTDG
jgi:cullin 3